MKKTGWFNESKRHSLASRGIKSAQKVPHGMCHSVSDKEYFGKKISADKYDYYLNVLPPLIIGKSEIIKFLEKWDNNPILVEKLNNVGVKGAFMQGEGFDKHDIYIRTDKDQYFKLGKTRNIYNTEVFRYEDWSKMPEEKFRRWNQW